MDDDERAHKIKTNEQWKYNAYINATLITSECGKIQLNFTWHETKKTTTENHLLNLLELAGEKQTRFSESEMLLRLQFYFGKFICGLSVSKPFPADAIKRELTLD